MSVASAPAVFCTPHEDRRANQIKPPPKPQQPTLAVAHACGAVSVKSFLRAVRSAAVQMVIVTFGRFSVLIRLRTSCRAAMFDMFSF